MKTLSRQGTMVNEDDIHWILTVPAIWADSAKQFMREAAYEVCKMYNYHYQLVFSTCASPCFKLHMCPHKHSKVCMRDFMVVVLITRESLLV